ncbi:MAG: DinB family protein [bacterium]|nr:DinB family protein [bacterium]
MNAKAIIEYGNKSFLKALDGVSLEIVEKAGACGVWSIKDILAHITKYEELFIEVFQGQLDEGMTVPTLVRMGNDHGKFNELGIDEGKQKTFDELKELYLSRFEKAVELVTKITPFQLRKVGTIPWYGKEYALDDLIVYLNYGHKREHGAQIALFKEIYR